MEKQLVLKTWKKLPKLVKKPLSWFYNKGTIKIDREMIEALGEYFSLGQKEVISLLKLGGKLNTLFWHSLNPKTEKEIEDFYKTTPFYVFDLVFWHSRREQRRFRPEVVKLAKGRILDYGGGIGDLCLDFAKRGFKVDYADVCGATFEFAKWLFQKKGLAVEMIDLSKDKPSKKYDMIICIDVVEHIANPKEILKDFARYLKDRGRLVITKLNPSDLEEHPMHFEIGFDVEEYLNSLGFVKTERPWLWIKSP